MKNRQLIFAPDNVHTGPSGDTFFNWFGEDRYAYMIFGGEPGDPVVLGMVRAHDSAMHLEIPDEWVIGAMQYAAFWVDGSASRDHQEPVIASDFVETYDCKIGLERVNSRGITIDDE